MNFLPGHSAPKDGTPIIGYWKSARGPEYDCLLGIVWRDPEPECRERDQWDGGAWFPIGDPDSEDTVNDPDYWHPMPNRDDYEELP